MGQAKRLIGLFLFTALLLIKVSAFHTYTHNDSDDIQDCETCILTLENQQEVLDLNISCEVSLDTLNKFDKYVNKYESIIPEKDFSGFLFGRPPPTSTILI
jgi:hypothetical protein